MDGLDIFNVYIMGSIEMLTVFHFFTRFLKKKVKFIYYILFAFLGMTIMMFFPTGSIMELLVYVLLLMAGGFFICRTYNIFVGLYAVVMIEIMHLCYGVFNSISCILSPLFFQENPKAVSVLFMVMSIISVVGLLLLFLLKGERAQKIVFYFMALLGMFIAWMTATGYATNQIKEQMISWGFGALAVVAVLVRLCGKSKNAALAAKLLAAASVVLGMVALFIG